MVEYQSKNPRNGFQKSFGLLLFSCLLLIFLGLILLFPPRSTRAEFVNKAVNYPFQGENDVFLPIIFRNHLILLPETPTPTITSTGTATPTGTQATPTLTGTPPTSTSTVTGTPPTSTPTSTPTITGTPPTPTPTVTGTITPNPRLLITVSPFQANVGERFTFSVEVTNIGTAPANDSVLTDSFPDYVDVESVTTSKGTPNRSTHSLTVNIGTIVPGDKITISIVVRANTRKLTTETVQNTVYLYYDSNGVRTAFANYRIVVTTLPGTGELPLNWQDTTNEALLNIQIFLIGGLGLVLFGLGVWAWKRGSANKYWMLGIGLILLFIFSATLLTEVQEQYSENEPGLQESLPGYSGVEGTNQEQYSLAVTPTLPERLPAYLFATPEQVILETLPSYPIPTPEITITPGSGIEEPDTSRVERIIIPAILLDTEVKYVPFDGITWLIKGLRYEIAWLGDTSWPGLGSNTVLAGHVTVSGIGNGPFRRLEDLGDGEFIYLHTEKNTYTYRVRGRSIVEDWDLSVVEPSDSPQLTLITCVEWDEDEEMYLKRLVLFAELVRVDPVLEGSTY